MEFLKWARSQWDRSAAILAAAGGLLALILGWLGASDNTNPAGQIPYVISGGLVGVFLVAIGSTLWLSADLRDEWRKLDRLEQRMAAQDRAVARKDSPTLVGSRRGQ
ncbi:MAG TPA: hypothetical protein VEG38_05870 [Acidimicrobiia bacterium]|nr:hypothetical protein [Acidimicrobiia bacterium]